MVCLCLGCFCFCPPAPLLFFFFPVYVFPFPSPLPYPQPGSPSPPHTYTPLPPLHPRSPPPPPISPLPLFLPPSLQSGSAGVHMIKQGTQVITWHCQIKRPLIQMRSEVSKTSVAFAATTYPHRRQRRDLRARGPAERQQQHSAFPS